MRSSDSPQCHRLVRSLAGAALVALTVCFASTRPTAATEHAKPAGHARTATTYDWQSMGHDASHTAYVKDAKMSAAIAPTLGVHWMTNLLSPDVGGPTIAFNPTVNKTLVYTGDERGNLAAYNLATGATVWSTSIGTGDAIYSTPLITSDETSVWVGTAFDAGIWKLNAATGALLCSQKTQLAIQMSPTQGFNSSGSTMIYAASIDGGNIAGPELGIAESNCSIVFSSNPYQVPYTGSWASPAYGLDAHGRGLVVQGTADPDSSEYALDSTTGALDWAFHTGLIGDYDIGAAATISAPGVNGFADGVLYFIDKAQIAYALDLTTGALIWKTSFGAENPLLNSRSAAALDRSTLVFGESTGALALNAITGAVLWKYTDPAGVEVLSNPAVVGPVGGEVVAFGDLAGVFHVLKLKTGAELYHYQTGGFITGSPSYVDGQFLIASTDGYLYDFAAGGGNGSTPTTTITSPTPGSSVPYASKISVTGTAAAAAGVSAVQVAVQSGGASGPWYNAATKTWQLGAMTNVVSVAQPGSPTSAWTFAIPVPSTGGAALQVFANAVTGTHQADTVGRQSSFTVGPSPKAPQLRTSAAFIAPAATFTATGSGFAAHETVSFTVGSVVVGSAPASSSGAVSATLTMPSQIPFGTAALAATGAKSHTTAVVPIDIANAWLQAGNGPTHAGYEPNDAVFSDVIWPGGNYYLDMAWYYTAADPVESSPAVYQDAVYFGNDSGTFAAVGTGDAAPLWTVKIPSGAPIRSSPAIDPSTADLAFTADDGALYVVTVAGGVSVQTVAVGGMLTSPTVNTGTVFVGSDSAVLQSINELSGKVNWSDTLGGPIHATPSLDPATNVVIAGDDSGAVSALNGSSGALIWRATTGAAVTGSPSIAGGIVYAGSGDGNVYAFNETTGAPVWTYKGGTPFTSGTAYDPVQKFVYAGGADGTVYSLDSTTGKLVWSMAPSNEPASAYSGISAAKHLAFAENTGGSLVAYRTSQFGRFNGFHQTAGALTTAPAVNDGTVYVGASDGGVYAYTTTGALPQTLRAHLKTAGPARVAQPPRTSISTPFANRAFSFAGRRDFALHVDAIRPTASPSAKSTGIASHPRRTYLVFWKPAGTGWESTYPYALTAALRQGSGLLAGTYVDATPVSMPLSDAAVQAEVVRTAAKTGWRLGADATVFVVTAGGAVPPGAGFCAYHSAFVPGGRSAPIIYAVVPYGGAVGACSDLGTTGRRTGDAALDAAAANIRRTQAEISRGPLFGGPSGVRP
jgi:outer membrane protein assembly factor BamB